MTTTSTGKKRKSLHILLAIFLALLIFAAGYYTSRQLEVPAYGQTLDQLSQLRQENISVKQTLNDAEAHIALLEQEARVVREANTQLQQGEQERQNEVARLRSDLAFYQRLAGAGGNPGLWVHALEMEPTQHSQVRRLMLTLTQNLQRANVVKGIVRLHIHGVEQGQPVTIDWSVLRPNNSEPLNFEFKYFQQLEGLITLPEGFQPDTVTVLVQAEGRDTVTANFDWRYIVVE